MYVGGKPMQYYGTLGPACGQVDILKKMFDAGMTGVRMNMSHGDLDANGHWLELLFTAAKECAVEKPQVLIDLRGPELRLGKVENEFAVAEGSQVIFGEGGLVVPKMLLDYAVIGDHILLDDGKLEFAVESVCANAHAETTDLKGVTGTLEGTAVGLESQMTVGTGLPCADNISLTARALRGGMVKSGKSLAIVGKELPMPTLTESDLKNISLAPKYGVTGVMQPFVRGKHDLITLRNALNAAGAEHIEIFAKIENLQGVAALDELLPYCDQVVIARGDLGNAMPLWKLPRVQKEISAKCRAAGKPFMVVTQMLDSMHERAVPTRAEVLDIYNAVLDGASSVMLTGETAAGKYPVEAITYLVKTGQEALV